jgi:fluoride exporter
MIFGLLVEGDGVRRRYPRVDDSYRRSTMRLLLPLAICGITGTLIRYSIQHALPFKTFPYGTLIVNLVGCALFGLVARHMGTWRPEWQMIVLTGFLGALTTFSSFNWELLQMLQQGQWGKAGLYMALSLSVGDCSVR